ncbi:hypothetical protein SAY87_010991 [Trapa incisa]|uniref:RNA uridylyltransferase n=1 Tax=Trapa incisa TaxID=236973 RepID=A0AAN7GMA5_9MYRT|nr:hypothetical protein SAY87_010991 [Trapa incisa]
MSGGGSDEPLQGQPSGGEFLLSLLQRSNHLQHMTSSQPPPRPQQQQPLAIDPAVAAVGPALQFPLYRAPYNGHDPSLPWPNVLSPPRPPLLHPHNYVSSAEDLKRSGLRFGADSRVSPPSGLPNIRFGARTLEFEPSDRLPNDNSLGVQGFNSVKEREVGSGSKSYDRLDKNRNFNGQESLTYFKSSSNPDVLQHRNFDSRKLEQSGRGSRRQQLGPNIDSRISAPPGFHRDIGNRGFIDRRRVGHEINAGEVNGSVRDLNNRNNLSLGDGNMRHGEFRSDGHRRVHGDRVLTGQLDSEVPAAHLNHVENSIRDRNDEPPVPENREEDAGEIDDLGEGLVESLLLDDSVDESKSQTPHRAIREKESRLDSRGQRVLSQRIRYLRRTMKCRSDVNSLSHHFLLIYDSLIPPDEEKTRQKQLLSLLERLVSKEWPEARLYLYGSCANSFGVCKSDIDVCLTIQDAEIDKSEFLLKLADILQADNLQNVQALTRARVPIVKLMDPTTGISCDICINNVLAVVNTKLLRDYAQIDVRLKQLAYIVKHWAKSRGVNQTYRGTLSSYAYVLMCIHFLQQRRPAILPCLQEMEPTYSVTVDDIECSYFDKVEKLCDFGSRNKETISQLVWAFFNYWAYCHDYANAVISVRSGCLISKQAKYWTRRVGNDRHLICIEDPFDTKHDLGRVVDKFSIKVLREEFERAAEIMQHDPTPWITLFEPYAPT